MSIYFYFLAILIVSAWTNKEFLGDLLSRKGGNLKENKEWHIAQGVQYVVIYLFGAFVLLTSGQTEMMYEYMIRLVFFALIFGGAYNTALNLMRGLKVTHTGIHDYAPAWLLLIVSIIGAGLAIAYELGGFNFIRFWNN